ncbi:MAG: phosphoribosylformylglycinamidine synthase subunit PurL [Bdellovibrionota bacterium]
MKEKLKHYRLNQKEYDKICEVLGRPPQGIEWALFSALWSEHCSYKSSKNHLRKFAYRNSSVVDGEGENAGVVDIGYGEKIAFKMESHNHPSFIEPFQGAATGVGGILRDIFTMGARPIALADYLCFGEPQAPRMKSLVKGVVSGISSYGNCVGVPTITGQTEFHSSYNNNILVNAMAVGLITEGQTMARSKAMGPGNWVVYVGAKTGKDGVHGASMASESFDENNDAKKPNVQIGDPFYEKLLIESCLEVLNENLVVAMQDMGAAGLTSSSFEMAARGEVGLDIQLDQVPLRDSSMNPEEILLSESQERMLLICEPSKFPRLQEVFHRWGLDAQKIGEVTKGPQIKLHWKNEILTDIDPRLIVDQAPRYDREFKVWPKSSQAKSENQSEIKKRKNKNLSEQLKLNSQSIELGSKNWIYRQYDQRVGVRTIKDASQAVGFLRMPSDRALAITLGCRPSVMRLDAWLGGLDAVFFPALQMAVKGATALAVTDCLNFGNPEKIEIMSEFVAAVEGIAEASKALDAPVVSGNVSFYNETQGQNITSTPSTGLIGIRHEVDNIPDDFFTQLGCAVYWVRCPFVTGFHSLKGNEKKDNYFTGAIDSGRCAEWIKSLAHLVSQSNIISSRAVGQGGLLETLRRMTLGGIGFEVQSSDLLNMDLTKATQECFYESIFAIEPSLKSKFEKKLQQLQPQSEVEFSLIGWTVPERFKWGTEVDISIDEIKMFHNNSWSQNLELK